MWGMLKTALITLACAIAVMLLTKVMFDLRKGGPK